MTFNSGKKKTQRYYLVNKGPSSQSCGFSTSHVWMWELYYNESGVPKNWCFWTVVLEKTLESPLDCKEIQPGHPEGDQSRIFCGRTDVEAETPILWPPDAKSWLFGKDPDAGKDWRQEEKGTTEDEMVSWHRWLSDMSLSELQELVKDKEAWRAAVHGVTKSRTWVSDWTTTVGRRPLPTWASKREECGLRAWQPLPPKGKKLPVDGADRQEGKAFRPWRFKTYRKPALPPDSPTPETSLRKSSRASDCSLTCELDLGNGKIPHPHPECTFCPWSPQWGHSDGRSLEGALWGWDPLDGAREWTQLRPMYKLVSFWQVSEGM